ncbi:tripartite motif-containing protein 2-like [Ruditapes philippinarum]|uniref:tripartite motif-containing protein 2-like n=1 Tax=Ruditapes philippinarum TaxID=129788 RepID=UPI00295BB7CD|nr:tripartite motif-containing protein 2-like [Ruditapes philippinarum]
MEKQARFDLQPRFLQIPSSPAHTGNSIELCENHLGEAIEFYCKAHEAYLCNDCVRLEHDTSPCKVVQIADLQMSSINPNDCVDTLKPIAAIIDKCKELSRTLQEKVNKTNYSYADIMNDVKTFKREINQESDELENFLKVELKAMQMQSNSDLNEIEELIQTSSVKPSCNSSEQPTVSNHDDDDLLLILQPSKDNDIKKGLSDSLQHHQKHTNEDDDDLLLFLT